MNLPFNYYENTIMEKLFLSFLMIVNVLMMDCELLLLNPMHRVSRELSGVNEEITSHLSDMLHGMEQVRMS